MTKIKICGLRRKEDAAMVNRWRPDFAGFVFAPGRRQVTGEQARQLRQILSPDIPAVGVFVKAAVTDIAELVDDGIIQLIQLHGDESNDYIYELRKYTAAPLIKVIRVKGPESLVHLEEIPCDYFLLDTFTRGQYGGAGKAFDHRILAQAHIPRPFFLAGGLTPENIAEAVRTVHPFGVDTSSGVETGGFKDEEKIRALISAVRKEDAQ